MSTDPQTPDADTAELEITPSFEKATQDEAPAAEVVPGFDAEFDEIVLKVGPGGGRTQRFKGRLLGETKQFTKAGIDQVRVYQSSKGKFVVQTQQSDWSDFSTLSNWVKDWKSWRSMIGSGDQDWGDFTVEVLDSVSELRNRIPPKLQRMVVDVVQNPASEQLDI